jgi:hypothetical protein
MRKPGSLAALQLPINPAGFEEEVREDLLSSRTSWGQTSSGPFSPYEV